jgi:hypothetical protein
MTPRKIIQIAVVPEGHLPETVFALCNDGTVWILRFAGPWCQLPDLPQDQPENPNQET